METAVRNYWLRQIGARVMHPTMGEFTIINLNCEYLYAQKPGETSVYKLRPNELIVTQPPKEVNEKLFIKTLEDESGQKIEVVTKNCKKRDRPLVEFRNLHVTFRNQCMKLSQEQAGSIYGKDHATTIHAIKSVSEWFATDKLFRQKYFQTLGFILDINPHALS